MDVDTATTAGDASTLGGKSEDQLVVLEAGNATNFGGYSVDHFMASDYNEFTSLTAEAINIQEHESGACDLTYTATPEMLDVKTGSGLGRHWANLTIGEATIFGNQFTTDGEPRIRLGDPTGTYLTIETGFYGNSENEIVFRNENGDYKGIGVTKIDLKVGGSYKQIMTDLDNLYYDEDIVWTAGNFTPTSKVTYHGSAASAPSEPVAGDEYYNTGDSKFYKYNGSSWIALN